MKVFNNPIKNIAYFGYRLINPIIDPIRLLAGIIGYVWYINDMVRYMMKDPSARLLSLNLYPILNEKVPYTPFDAHYYYQELWLFEQVLREMPKKHIDIASSHQLSGYISKLIPTTFIDMRPVSVKLKNLTIKKGNLLKLPYRKNSVHSLSCLHSIEHVGLGRYGDSIDPKGTKKACHELSRILAVGGKLYISLPIGKDRICFNAHRVHSLKTVLKYFEKLKLISYSIITDDGKFYEKVNPKNYSTQNYACGLFMFTKL